MSELLQRDIQKDRNTLEAVDVQGELVPQLGPIYQFASLDTLENFLLNEFGVSLLV